MRSTYLWPVAWSWHVASHGRKPETASQFEDLAPMDGADKIVPKRKVYP